MTFTQAQLRRQPDAQVVPLEPVDDKGHRPELDIYNFRSIYDAYWHEVARWIRALGGPAADQDDLIQEVFVVVYRRLPDFDGRNLVGWLYRITAHQVRDYRRLVWVKHIFRRGGASSSEMSEMRAATPTPLMALEIRERQRKLERILSKLSDRLRATFVLFEIEGYTAEEIAEMHSVRLAAVRARIHRARKKLMALLDSSAESHWNFEATARVRNRWSP